MRARIAPAATYFDKIPHKDMGEENMTSQIVERVLTEATHIKDTHDTIRKTAEIYGISKSTVHNDMAVKLRYIDHDLYSKTRAILKENFDEKHIRGGQSTKQKYARCDEKESEI